MAERQGFEPWIEFPLYTLSKRAPSATRPSLQLRAGSGLEPAKTSVTSSLRQGRIFPDEGPGHWSPEPGGRGLLQFPQGTCWYWISGTSPLPDWREA
jgi:hypothetical protein